MEPSGGGTLRLWSVAVAVRSRDVGGQGKPSMRQRCSVCFVWVDVDSFFDCAFCSLSGRARIYTGTGWIIGQSRLR